MAMTDSEAKTAWQVYDVVHGIGSSMLGGEQGLGGIVGMGTSALMKEAVGDDPRKVDPNTGKIDPTVDNTIAGDVSAAPGVGNNNPDGVGLGNEITNVNGKSLSTITPSSTDGNNWSKGVSNIANPYISHDENTQDYA